MIDRGGRLLNAQRVPLLFQQVSAVAWRRRDGRAGRGRNRALLPAMAGIATVATHDEPAHADRTANR